jgi:hypothetical protein
MNSGNIIPYEFPQFRVLLYNLVPFVFPYDSHVFHLAFQVSLTAQCIFVDLSVRNTTKRMDGIFVEASFASMIAGQILN